MHRCLKCGKVITNIDEIQNGCSCGSKVFVFIKNGADAPVQKPSSISLMGFAPSATAPENAPLPQTNPAEGKISPLPPALEIITPGGEGKNEAAVEPPSHENAAAPENIPARENITAPKNIPAKEIITAQPQAKKDAMPSQSSDSNILDEADKPSMATGGGFAGQSDAAQATDSKWEEVWLAKGGSVTLPSDGSGVENLRQLAKGVYELDVFGLSNGPLVVRDEEGVYYVRLPFSQTSELPRKN